MKLKYRKFNTYSDMALFSLAHRDFEYLGKFDEDVVERFNASLDFNLDLILPDNMKNWIYQAMYNATNFTDGPFVAYTNTDVRIFYTIEPLSVQAILTPHTKFYHVGKTHHGRDEKVIWTLNPNKLSIGYVNERTTRCPGEHYVDKQTHKFGRILDIESLNIIISHVHEYDYKKYKHVSDIDIVVYVPIPRRLRNMKRLEEVKKNLVESVK